MAKRRIQTRVHEVSGGLAVVLSARASKLFVDAVGKGAHIYVGVMTPGVDKLKAKPKTETEVE